MSDDSGQIVRARSRRPSVKFFLLLWLILALLGECLWYFVGPPPRYTTEAKFQRTSDVASADENGITRGDAEARKLVLEYELVGLAAMEQAAEDEGLTKGLEHDPKNGQLTAEGMTARQELVKGLLESTRVRWDARSEPVDLIAVVFTHHDRDVAQRMPNRLVMNYIDRTGEKTKQELQWSMDFLRKRVTECDARVDAQIQKRQEFEKQHRDVRPQDPTFLPQKIGQTERDLDRALAEKVKAETKLALLGVLTPKTTSAPGTIQFDVFVPNPKLAKMKEELQASKDDRNAALRVQGMSQSHPSVVALDRKIAMLEERINEAETQPTSRPVYVSGGPSTPDVLGYQDRMARLEIELADKELTRLRVRHEELDGLQGRWVVARREYAKLVEREKEIEKEGDSWRRRESDVQMALSAELANRRTHLSAVQAAQRPTGPDAIASPWVVAGATLAWGFVLSGLLTLLIWAGRVAPGTTAACLVLLALILSLVFIGPVLREGGFFLGGSVQSGGS